MLERLEVGDLLELNLVTLDDTRVLQAWVVSAPEGSDAVWLWFYRSRTILSPRLWSQQALRQPTLCRIVGRMRDAAG